MTGLGRWLRDVPRMLAKGILEVNLVKKKLTRKINMRTPVQARPAAVARFHGSVVIGHHASPCAGCVTVDSGYYFHQGQAFAIAPRPGGACHSSSASFTSFRATQG